MSSKKLSPVTRTLLGAINQRGLVISLLALCDDLYIDYRTGRRCIKMLEVNNLVVVSRSTGLPMVIKATARNQKTDNQ